MTSVPLVTVPVTFFDSRTGLSAFAVQHLRADGRTVLVFHDAPGPAAAHPLLTGIAEAIADDMDGGHALTLVETSMPQHPAENFVFARVAVTRVPPPGGQPASPGLRLGADPTRVPPTDGVAASSQLRLSAHPCRVLPVEAVAQLCGVTVAELRRTGEIAAAVYRPRCCAFEGFRQLVVGRRGPALRVVAGRATAWSAAASSASR